MIILIDNENYMIRYCKDSPEIHGFSTNFPNWKGYMRFLSDIGFTVVVSGEEAEEYLDESGIYYIHVENKAKESFHTFVRRLERLVRENKEFLDVNLSFGKLVFAVTEDGEKGTIHTENLAEIWRSNEDRRYYLITNIDPDALKHKREAAAITVEKALVGEKTTEELEEISEEVDEIIDYTDADNFEKLLSADTFREAKMDLLAVCELLAA